MRDGFCARSGNGSGSVPEITYCCEYKIYINHQKVPKNCSFCSESAKPADYTGVLKEQILRENCSALSVRTSAARLPQNSFRAFCFSVLADRRTHPVSILFCPSSSPRTPCPASAGRNVSRQGLPARCAAVSGVPGAEDSPFRPHRSCRNASTVPGSIRSRSAARRE